MTSDFCFRPSAADITTLACPEGFAPTLTVVVDTEEEFDWSAGFDPANRSVANIAEQWHAQAVFDQFGVVPTYVVDYPVAANPAAAQALREFLRQGRCDIGAHLHPWVTPPDECRVPPALSYPGNLPAPLEFAKLKTLTEKIEDTFGHRPHIYKAGRYGLGPRTREHLVALGYRVDVSLVPHTDFSADGGPDYSAVTPAPAHYGDLLALPLTVTFAGILGGAGAGVFNSINAPIGRALRLPAIAARLGLLEKLRLSPEGHDLDDMRRQVDAALRQGIRVFMLTYHSSSLLPGGAPYVRDPAQRAAFVAKLHGIVSYFLSRPRARSLSVDALARALRGSTPDRQ